MDREYGTNISTNNAYKETVVEKLILLKWLSM